MNPIIQAAWIAGAAGAFGAVAGITGGVIVARIGLNSNRESTAVAIAASSADVKAQIEAATADNARALDADRGHRLWEKQAAMYVDVIANIRHQQKIRESKMQSLRVSDPHDLPRPPVDWTQLEARVLGYASPAVLAAFGAASDAGLKHSGSYNMYVTLADQERERNELRGQGFPSPAAPPGTVQAARQTAVDTLKEAEAKDDALIALIRAELHNKPSRAGELPRSIDSIYQPPDH